MDCYTHEEIVLSGKPLLSNVVVSQGYLVTMHNSTRQYRDELMSANPVSNITIIHNKGIACKQKHKLLFRPLPHHDLLHCMLHVFQDALKKGFDRILWM